MQATVLGHPTFNRKLLPRPVILEGRGEGGSGKGGGGEGGGRGREEGEGGRRERGEGRRSGGKEAVRGGRARGGGRGGRDEGERGGSTKRPWEIRAAWRGILCRLLMLANTSIISPEISEIRVEAFGWFGLSGGMLSKDSIVSKCIYFVSRSDDRLLKKLRAAVLLSLLLLPCELRL